MSSDIKHLTDAITTLANATLQGSATIAKHLENISDQLQYLGNGDSEIKNGSLKTISTQLYEGFSEVSSAIHALSDELKPSAGPTKSLSKKRSKKL